MLAPVHDLGEAQAAAPELAALGYRREDHRPQEALWFCKQPGDDYQARTHQLHLTRTDSDLWRERVAFRDALRADPALLREYQALKQHLSSALDLAEYTQGKRGFVATVLKAAGVDLAKPHLCVGDPRVDPEAHLGLVVHPVSDAAVAHDDLPGCLVAGRDRQQHALDADRSG